MNNIINGKVMPYQTPRLIEHIGGAAISIGQDCYNLLAFIGELSVASVYAVAHPRKVRWRETFYYMDMCGSDALPIVTMICFLMGVILGFQAAVQMAKFGTDIYVADLVGFSICKELGPLMVAMICTGRAGSAFAAEIGTMKVAEEVDAMRTMGLVPSRFLVIPKMLAMILVMPVLTVYGNLAGMVGGMTVGVMKLGLPISAYYDRTVQVISPMTFSMGIVKSVFFAILIAGVGCMRGFEAKNDAQSVGRSATSAVVSAIFLVVVADAVLTMLFSLIGY